MPPAKRTKCKASKKKRVYSYPSDKFISQRKNKLLSSEPQIDERNKTYALNESLKDHLSSLDHITNPLAKTDPILMG